MYFPNFFQKCNHKTSENIFLGRIWIPLHFSSYICISWKNLHKKKVKKSTFAKPTNEIFWVSKTTNIQTLRKRVRIIFRYFLLNLYIFIFILVHIRPLYDSCSWFCSQWNIYVSIKLYKKIRKMWYFTPNLVNTREMSKKYGIK